MMTCDVAIIGGGISGCAAAYELARAGMSVTLIEKGALASMASGWTLAGVRQSGPPPRSHWPLRPSNAGRGLPTNLERPLIIGKRATCDWLAILTRCGSFRTWSSSSDSLDSI